MRLSISGVAPDKTRKEVTWVDGTIQADAFLKPLYDALGREMKQRMMLHSPAAISNVPDNGFSMSAFFYISRFILKDVKITEGSISKENFLPEGAKA